MITNVFWRGAAIVFWGGAAISIVVARALRRSIAHWSTSFLPPGFPVIVLGYALLARKKNRLMLAPFGEEYRTYQREVRSSCRTVRAGGLLRWRSHSFRSA